MSDDLGRDTPYPEVEQQPDYPRLEERILAFWEADGTFEASVAARAGGDNEYVFYDGPPFANGLPHYGHLLTGFVKDAVPRYQTMRGRRVERRFGWDCHGLPAEMPAEKELGVAGPGRRHRFRHRPFQRLLPLPGPAHHRLLGPLRDPPGPLGRLHRLLQDHGPRLHGERHVGLQPSVGEGAGLRRRARPALLLGMRDTALELRDPPGRRLPRPGSTRR